MVATGAIQETEWFGDEVSNSTRILTHNYERGSDTGLLKSFTMWNDVTVPFFQI